MKTTNKNIGKTYTVPMDMLMDILRIIIKNELPNHIEGINVKENTVMLKVKFPEDHPYSKEAKENIEGVLEDYGYYANGAPEDRESGENPYSSEDDN